MQSSDIGLVYSSLNELYMSLTDLVGSRSIILIIVYSSLNELYMSLTDLVGSRSIILIDGRVIAAYSRGKIVLPKSGGAEQDRHVHLE
jgi:hypothetical protein